MATQHFNVYIRGTGGGLPEDWKRAMHAPEEELPKLSKEQSEIAKRMEIAEKDYARGVLAGTYAEQRNKIRGELLGERVDQILSGLGPGYVLSAVIREATELRWIARIATPKGIRDVVIPLELAEDVIDSPALEVLERLRRLILPAVGREELVVGDAR